MVERLTSSQKIDDSTALARLGCQAPHALDNDLTRLMRALF